MTKRIISLILSVLLISGALGVFSFNALEPVSGLSLDSGGILHWNAYPGATMYSIGPEESEGLWMYTSIDSDKTSFDLYSYLSESKVPTGSYKLTFSVYDIQYNEVASSEISFSYTGLERLSTPKNLRWEDYKICCDEVSGADEYYFIVFISGTALYAEFYSPTPVYDVSQLANDSSQKYEFKVKAIDNSGTYASSKFSNNSSPKRGRFSIGSLNISLNGDVLSWKKVKSSEGKYSNSYYIYSLNGFFNEFGWYYTEKINLFNALYAIGTPSGRYGFNVIADWNEIAITNESNSVSYDFDPGSYSDALMLGGIYFAPGTEYSTRVYVNGVTPEYSGPLYIKAGSTVTVHFSAPVGEPVECVRLYSSSSGESRYYPLNELTRIGESSVYYAEFTAPDVDFDIYVENREDINPFVDIKRTDYFYNPVIWAVTSNPAITKGTSADRFSPDASCTRGQVVTFLWRAAGEPLAKDRTNPFVDVKEGDYFYEAVLWAVERGITNGLDKTHFGPDAKCTRGQVVTFLWRFCDCPGHIRDMNPFKDISEKDYFYNAVLWAIEQSITNGTSAYYFSPNQSCTRGQIVTFLWRDTAI